MPTIHELLRLAIDQKAKIITIKVGEGEPARVYYRVNDKLAEPVTYTSEALDALSVALFKQYGGEANATPTRTIMQEASITDMEGMPEELTGIRAISCPLAGGGYSVLLELAWKVKEPTLPPCGVTILFGGSESSRCEHFVSLVEEVKSALREGLVINRFYDSERPHHWRKAIISAQKHAPDVIAIRPCLEDSEECSKAIVHAMQCGHSLLCLSEATKAEDALMPFSAYLKTNPAERAHFRCINCA